MALFIGVIVLSFGVYQMVCYLYYLPTMRTGKEILKTRNRVKITFFDMISILMAEKAVTKYQIQWNDANAIEEVLKKKGIYTNGTVYVVSRIIYYVLGALLLLPLFLFQKVLFIAFIVVWTIIMTSQLFVMHPFKKENNRYDLRKIKNYKNKLLPGVFLITEIIIIICLLT